MSATVTTQAPFNTTSLTTKMEPSRIRLTFGPPKEEEYEAIAKIIADSFAESSRALFGDFNAEILAFRVSLIRQRDSLMRLYQQGKINTPHHILIARDAKTESVIGVAIWSMEDDWTEKGIQERIEEMKLAPPMAKLPSTTNMPLYNKCQVDFAHMQARYMQNRPRCYLKYLCVDATVQRSGAGTALLKIIRKEAGNRPIYLEAADTRPAVKFYMKLNFDDMGVFGVGEATFNAMKLEPSTPSLLDEE